MVSTSAQSHQTVFVQAQHVDSAAGPMQAILPSGRSDASKHRYRNDLIAAIQFLAGCLLPAMANRRRDKSLAPALPASVPLTNTIKKTSQHLLHRISQTGKYIDTFIKQNAKIGLVGLALASPLVLANKADAGVEGYVAVTYNVSGVGGYPTGIDFIEGASSGWDVFDTAYHEMPFVWDAHAKAVGTIEGEEAASIALPDLESGDSVSESFNGSLVVNHGKSISLDNASHYLTWSLGGDLANDTNADISINGMDARTTNRLEFGTLTGSYGEGEHSTSSWTISVTYNQPTTEPNTPTEEPNEVRSNTGTLEVREVHEKMLDSAFYLVHKNGASDEPNDPDDLEYVIQGEVTNTYLVSHVLDSKTGQFRDLTTDVRSTGSYEPVFLQQKVHSDFGFVRIPGGQDTNALVFSIPDSNESFGDRVPVFREIYRTDPNDPNFYEEGAPFLVKDAIAADPNSMAVYLLPKLEKKIPSGTINEGTIEFYSTVPLAVADFNKDGVVDVNDGYLLEGAMGYEGNSMFDIARLKDPLALPGSNNYGQYVIGQGGDNIVNGTDMNAFNELLISDEKRRGVYDPNE